MDFTYSNLAYMDAYHDYKKYFTMNHYKDIIISGLPSKYILPINSFVSNNDFEDLVLDIFTARQKEVTVLDSFSSDDIFRLLKKDKDTFGLIGDARGAVGLVEELEKQNNKYYIIRNIENKIDSSRPTLYYNYKVPIIVNDAIYDITYPKWNKNVCISSKFCSNFNINLKYKTNFTVIYKIGKIKESIDLNNYGKNPNNRTFTRKVIASPKVSNLEKAIAFQRKRSGDWLQALSSAHTDRLYKLPSGEVQKLNCSIYFCTEDRVAAAYSLALGLETIFHQRGSSVKYLYTPNKTTMNTHDFDCAEDKFTNEEIDMYKKTIRDAVNIYELMIAIVKEEIESERYLESDLLRYIGYLYEYELITDMFDIMIKHSGLVKKFLEGTNRFTKEQKNTLYKVYICAKEQLPEIIEHDIHTIPRFPCMTNVQPISTTGIVGDSEIYVSGLLHALIHSEPFIVNAIEKCVHTILRKSTSSESFQFHYQLLLSEIATKRMVGGRVPIPYTVVTTIPVKTINKNTKEMYELGKTYLAYLYLYCSDDDSKSYPFTYPLHQINLGEFSQSSNFEATLAGKGLALLVEKYGILEKEYEEYLKCDPDGDSDSDE